MITAALKRKRPKLSIREAARRAGISEGWWRQVVRGYQPLKGGGKAPMRGSAETVAAMARVVGVTPEQLEEAGRADAAAELRALAASDETTAGGLAARVAELRAEADRLEREMLQLADEGDETGPGLEHARQLMAMARRELDQARRARQ